MKVPEGVSVEVKPGKIVVTGPKGTVEKDYDASRVGVSVENGEVTFKALVKERRKISAAVYAVEAHVRNMFKGVKGGFEKKLTVVYAHFPVTVEVKGAEVHIKNFMGEKSVRVAKIIPGAKVVVAKQDITVNGADTEAVGQTAANIKRATNITRRDRRIFQDGIYEVI